MEIKISNRLIPYKTAMKFLQKRVDKIKIGKEIDLLWILEHPITYTAGIRSKKNEILDKKIKVISTNRGGKITVHNPGQKIIYFAVDLNKKKKDVRKFISILEKSIIQFLKKYNIKSNSDKKNIGIWVKNKKIAAIGVRITKWIAYHGCSINVSNNLKDYKKILPCGLENSKITSIKEEGIKKISNQNKNLINIFCQNLKEF
ncbi:lipoyl(octanoyl) transferase LipB [Pelagibacteraceae bacterium]|nr:lipoyl(octanoyl) transferase LipB [Pelagibacteraceae bacterium]